MHFCFCYIALLQLNKNASCFIFLIIWRAWSHELEICAWAKVVDVQDPLVFLGSGF